MSARFDLAVQLAEHELLLSGKPNAARAIAEESAALRVVNADLLAACEALLSASDHRRGEGDYCASLLGKPCDCGAAEREKLARAAIVAARCGK